MKALIPLRGAYSSARLLPHLDYDLIRRHPKILIAFSDAASLLLGIHARTGLVTFHGPMAMSRWAPFGLDQWRRLLFRGEATRIANPAARPGAAASPIRTLVPGRAQGRLLGGNLTVLSSMVGSPYLEGAEGAILFLQLLEPAVS